MQNLVWKAITKQGKLLSQQQNGNYFDFCNLNKQELICFTVFNKNNNSNYMINLKTGQFVFNGIPFTPSIQINDLDYDFLQNIKIDIAKNLFWYNQMSCDFNVLTLKNTNISCTNTYFGYKVDLDLDYTLNNIQGKIISSRPMIKIQNNNNKVTFSNKLTFKYFENEIEKKIQL